MSHLILLKEIAQYKKIIMNKKIIGGFTKDYGEALKGIKKYVERVGNTENINKLYLKLQDFENEIDQYVHEIESTNINGSKNVSMLQLTTDEINKKINTLNETLLNILKNGSFYYNNEEDVIQIEKEDTYDKVLGAFKLILVNYDKQLLRIQKIKDIDGRTNIPLYIELNSSLKKNMTQCAEFNKWLDETINYIKKQLHFSFGEYEESEIILAITDVYNYSKRLSTSDKIDIKPGKINAMLDISTELLNALNVSTDFITFDESIDNINITFENLTKVSKKESVGGNPFYNEEIVKKVHDKFVDLSMCIENTNLKLEKFYGLLVDYKIFKTQYNNFIIYLMLIATQNKFSDTIMPYKYINKGLLQFYLTIIEKILGDIKLNKNRSDTIYFFEHHYLTLVELEKFCKFLIGNIKTLDVIDIEKCVGNVKKTFVIFNYFKDILDSYNEVWEQNKINIYARINDWAEEKNNTSKMFKSDKTDAKTLIVDKSVCDSLKNTGKTKIRFSEVFDSENFVSNNNITKYMTLETKLSQKKGVMLMTYGYSGTGKTFTLFGNDANQGLLQSTLNGIRGLEEVKFRVIELYGYGVQYPHYWKDSSNVKQCVIKYNLNVQNDKIVIVGNGEEESNVTKVINNTTSNFISLEENIIEKVFKNFTTFIEQLDSLRKHAGRIRRTSNNPESSRSVVIYEFYLLIDQEYVPFVIIDLPGREEIVETYRDGYLNNPQIPHELRTNFNKAILTAMSINPLALSILCPTIIAQTFNELDNEQKQKILGYNKMTGTTLKDENFGLGKNLKLKYLLNLQGNSITIRKNHNYIEGIQGQKEIIGFDINNDGSMKFGEHSQQIPAKVNSVQYQGVLAIFIINRCILTGSFDILEKLYINIVNAYFKIDTTRVPIDEKKDFLQKNLAISIDKVNSHKINLLYAEALKFTTYLAPFEGIYINENIMGLLKVLAKRVARKTDQYILSHLTSTQDKTLDFDVQKEKIRNANFKLYTQIKGQDSEQYENIYMTESELIKLQQSNYSSQKIYEYDKPFIESIVDIYTHKRDNIKEVSFFKMFYLFSNNDLEKKCEHQWKLLNDTLAFVNTVNETK